MTTHFFRIRMLALVAVVLATFFSAFSHAAVTFYHDIVNHAEGEDLSKSRIDIYVEVVYDDLQFIKLDNNFQAAYELSAVIMDGNNQVDGKIWKQTVDVKTFEMTNSRGDISLTHADFTLDPGKYKVIVTIEDLEGGEANSKEEKIELDSYKKYDISASGITFARRVEFENNQIKSIFPQVTTPVKGLGNPSYAFFEVYNQTGSETGEISYEIRGENSKYQFTDSMPVTLTGERTGVAIQLPVDSLEHDSYKLSIDIKADRKTARTEKDFYMRWAGLPRNAEDLETAIQQVQYIARQPEWKKLKKAPKDKKLEAFVEFWEKRDPSPATEYNEMMQNYYARINMANEAFTVMGRDGWKSDRGMVFIILGQPDEVIRNDYPQGSKPYQIWQYYSINRQFEFYDRNGFGDYELLNPISIYELQRFARY